MFLNRAAPPAGSGLHARTRCCVGPAPSLRVTSPPGPVRLGAASARAQRERAAQPPVASPAPTHRIRVTLAESFSPSQPIRVNLAESLNPS